MSEMSKELRLWAKDDIVPSDLQALCEKAANAHEGLAKACEAIANLSQHGDIMASLYGSGRLVAQCQAALEAAGVEK